MWHSARCHQLCTLKKLSSAAQCASRPTIQARPSAGRPCISITCATAWWAQQSRGSAATASRPAASASAWAPDSSSPKACMPSTKPRPGTPSQWGRARAMRSRRVRASARRKSSRCPACSAVRSRGKRREWASSARAPRVQSPASTARSAVACPAARSSRGRPSSPATMSRAAAAASGSVASAKHQALASCAMAQSGARAAAASNRATGSPV